MRGTLNGCGLGECVVYLEKSVHFIENLLGLGFIRVILRLERIIPRFIRARRLHAPIDSNLLDKIHEAKGACDNSNAANDGR